MTARERERRRRQLRNALELIEREIQTVVVDIPMTDSASTWLGARRGVQDAMQALSEPQRGSRAFRR